MNYRFSLDDNDDEWEYIIPSSYETRTTLVLAGIIVIIVLLIFGVIPWLTSP